MVRNPALREVICAYALAAVARTYLALALVRLGLRRLALVKLQQPAFEHAHGLVAVLMLAALVLALHHKPRRYVRNPYCAFGFVNVLSARAAASVCVYLQIVGVYFNLHVLRLRQYRNSRRARVYAPLRFRLRHALHPVHSAFKLHAAVCALSLKREHNFLHAALFRVVFVHKLGLVAVPLGVAGIHAQKIRPEQRRFLAARARAHFYYNVLVVVGILGQQHNFKLLAQFMLLRAQPVKLLVYHFAHCCVVRFLQHGPAAFYFRIRRHVFVVCVHYVRQPRLLLAQLAVAVLVAYNRGVAQKRRKLLVSFLYSLKLLQHKSRSVQSCVYLPFRLYIPPQRGRMPSASPSARFRPCPHRSTRFRFQ